MLNRTASGWIKAFVLSLILVAGTQLLVRAAAAQAPELKIGWFPVPNAEPLFVALEKGYFGKAGVHVDTVQVQGGAQSVEAALAGAIDGSIGGTIPMAYAALKNVPIKMVITNGSEPPGSHLAAIVVPTDSNIHKVSDLKGKTVALYCLRCITHASTLKAASEAGLSASDFRAIEMPGPSMLTAVLNHQVDAIYLYEPLLSQALAKGTRVVIYEDQIFPNMAMGGFFFTDKVIASKKNAVQGFVNGMREAMKFIQSNPRESKLILGKHLKLDPAIASSMGAAYYDPSGKLDLAQMNDVIKTMMSLKMMTEMPDIKSVATDEFLK